MNLDKVTINFNGMLVIGDLHADVDSLRRARQYALHHNLFIVSLGDLVDRGPCPYETVVELLDIVDNGNGALVIGNHDSKHYRYALGNPVEMSGDPQNTLLCVGTDRVEQYLSAYKALYEHARTGVYHYIGNWTFVHAAAHVDILERKENLSAEAYSYALYGEVTGKRDIDGKPERVYNWINHIPKDEYVIVGHDRKAIHDVMLSHPMLLTNKDTGGSVIFADTGCGKTGVLSGVVLTFVPLPGHIHVSLSRFIQFGE